MPSVVASLQTIVDGTRTWTDRDYKKETVRIWSSFDQRYIEDCSDSVNLFLNVLGNSQNEETRTRIDRVPPHPAFPLRLIISTILNAFPMELGWVEPHPEERPAGDLEFGIRPVLMAMLRRDILLKREVRLCVRPGCSRYFIATRIDKRCCDARCTEKMKSRRQYLLRTKPQRQKEAKRKKSQKKGQP